MFAKHILFSFVRFNTLSEAMDAVKAKHLKIIGNKKVNVALSSTTMRRLQMSPEEEGKKIWIYV